MGTATSTTRVEYAGHCGSELDDLVLRLKALVLARRYRESLGADLDELDTYNDEIATVRDQLAAHVGTRIAA
ncbi:MAG TPA: hypothetical protein VGU02_13075 [Gaiellaceae bacterium]|nr:hypothetical protein [Gaiellaceae bacterium]